MNRFILIACGHKPTESTIYFTTLFLYLFSKEIFMKRFIFIRIFDRCQAVCTVTSPQGAPVAPTKRSHEHLRQSY